MNYRVKNWHTFQHYSSRRPPWIKLHRKLLDDLEFKNMPIVARALAPMMWLLASESDDGTVQGPDASIADRLRLPEREVADGLKFLLQFRFLAPSEDLFDERKHDASALQAESEQRPPPDCPHEQIVELYHQLLPMCPRVRFWDERRRKFLRNRWQEDPKRQDLDWWRRFFEHASRSPFLTGRSSGRGDQPPFLATLEWLVRPSNIVKVIEGNYDRG